MLSNLASNIVKVVLATLFFACLLDMPYGFYQLVRFTALIGFAYLAYQSYTDDLFLLCLLYIAAAILFQPIFKISLGRQLWNYVDVVAGVGLIISIFLKPKPAINSNAG